MSEELKPCPFCGEVPDPSRDETVFEADDIGGWLAGCCAQTWGNTRAEAITAWNTRPAPKASIPDALERIAHELPEGVAWVYQTTVRGGRLYHQWQLNGPRGGIHVDAWFTGRSDYTGRSWIGGIEGHSPIPQSDYDEQKGEDHAHCWLIGGPCWHDGSSLQFSEEIAPYLPIEDRVMGEHQHAEVMRVMLSRYNSWLPSAQAIEARKGGDAKQAPSQDESAVRQDAPKP